MTLAMKITDRSLSLRNLQNSVISMFIQCAFGGVYLIKAIQTFTTTADMNGILLSAISSFD